MFNLIPQKSVRAGTSPNTKSSEENNHRLRSSKYARWTPENFLPLLNSSLRLLDSQNTPPMLNMSIKMGTYDEWRFSIVDAVTRSDLSVHLTPEKSHHKSRDGNTLEGRWPGRCKFYNTGKRSQFSLVTAIRSLRSPKFGSKTSRLDRISSLRTILTRTTCKWA